MPAWSCSATVGGFHSLDVIDNTAWSSKLCGAVTVTGGSARLAGGEAKLEPAQIPGGSARLAGGEVKLEPAPRRENGG
ncbi:hypothetical protein F0402_07530 [Mycolicibacter arupensis]|nr:hypothetical protein F0402_07530 [Mycolicibacter arupensis]